MTVQEKDLPLELDGFGAVGAAYPEELTKIVQTIQQRLSVMVECEKEITQVVFRHVRDRLRTGGLQCMYLDGRPDPNGPPVLGGVVANLLAQVADCVRGAAEDRVLVLPHLDLLTTSSAGLTSTAQEAIALLHENPETLVIGFRDPSMPVPRVIEGLFPRTVAMSGIKRDRLPLLVTQSEARKFGRELDLYQLYKYVSGLNPVRLRRLLSAVVGEDYPDDPKPAFAQLRSATLTQGLEIPSVDLHKDIGGYKRVKDQIQREILDLMVRKDGLKDEGSIRQIEGLLPRGIIFHGPAGTGKCLGRGTPVLKFDGEICPVEKIQTGDLLMGPDSTPRMVLSTTVGYGPLYKIQPVRGSAWVCNEPHIMTLVHSTTGKVVDIPLDEHLKKSNDWKHSMKLFSTAVDFQPGEDLPIDPYFMGAWFGDGGKSIGKYGLLGVNISKPDDEIRDACAAVARKFDLTLKNRAPEQKCPLWCLVGKMGTHNNALLKVLRDLVGTNINVPRQYLTSSRENRAEFLAGWIDTDGHNDNNCVELVQKRTDWADAIAFVARSLGFKVTESDKSVLGYGVYRRLNISGDFSKIPTRIKRKQIGPRKQKKNPLRTGFSATLIGDGEYFGFTLDGDGRFLLGDFTVTHNTLFAKAMATSLGAAIQIVSGPEIKSKWFGESEQNLRNIFRRARQSAPAIIVFDELDSIAGARGRFSDGGGAGEASHSIVNQLLTEMDGFRKEELVFVVGTTNFVESLDPALLRPGRFEFHIHIPYPEDLDRKEIIEIYDRKFSLHMPPCTIEHTVQRTNEPYEATGSPYSGDHIQALCRQIARQRLRTGAQAETLKDDVDEAVELNVERPDFTEDELRTIATHEAGHAIVAMNVPHAPPIERVSIRGDLSGAAGFVKLGNPRNRFVMKEGSLLDRIAFALGGREAESLLMGELSIGAAHDLFDATNVARLMVEELGLGKHAIAVQHVDHRDRFASEKTKQIHNEEIARILREQESRAKKILAENKKALEALRDLLMEKRTLRREDLAHLGGK